GSSGSTAVILLEAPCRRRSRISLRPVKFLLRSGISPQITGTAPSAGGSASVIKNYRTRWHLIAAEDDFMIFAGSHDNRVLDDALVSINSHLITFARTPLPSRAGCCNV